MSTKKSYCTNSEKPQISLLWPTKISVGVFDRAIESIKESCSDPKKIEILFKVEDGANIDYLQETVSSIGCNFYVIINDLCGYQNMHIFFNEIFEHAVGDLIFTFADDLLIYGDWVQEFLASLYWFKDGIYVINTRSHSWTPYPVISRRFVSILGYVSPCHQIDSWVQNVAKQIGRYPHLPESKISIVHDHVGPPSQNTIGRNIILSSRSIITSQSSIAAQKLKSHLE